MSIPDYQTIMLPLLRLLEDNQEHSLRQTIDTLGEHFNLTPGERKQLLPSGQKAVFNNRVGWAVTYLRKTALLETTQRGIFRITTRGLDILQKNPRKIDRKLLEQFEEYRTFVNAGREKPTEHEETAISSKTPEDILADAYLTLRNDLAKDLLEQIKANPPSLFENIVIDLLLKMNYGGGRDEAGKAIGKTGDGGIDGIIKEDRLGLDVIYVQAKRWDGTVGRPEIHKFAGALQGKHARKGIFITTSNFSREAIEFASGIENKIVLIDGNQLAQLMIEHNVGVSTQANYEIKKIDLDYFTE